jgi:hypothetical protein
VKRAFVSCIVRSFLLLFSFESFKAYPSTFPSPHEVCTHFPTFPLTFRSATTEHGSFKLTDISYRLRFSFVSFACIVRSFFAFRSLALCSFVSCTVRFVRQFDYTNARNEIRTNDTNEKRKRYEISVNLNDPCSVVADRNVSVNVGKWVQTSWGDGKVEG